MTKGFEGWYFKQQNQSATVAFIPAIHSDGASIQLIAHDRAYRVQYPSALGTFDRRDFVARVGDSQFSKEGLTIDIRDKTVTAAGKLAFGPLTPLRTDIMGPFALVPFMECRHSVFSMSHSVDGWVEINDKRFTFDHSLGYIEGDRGYSFPTRYLWTQCNHGNTSVMLSIASIPFAGANFTGVICAIIHEGREYRLATYRGARGRVEGNKGVVEQGDYVFSAELLSGSHMILSAPTQGSMGRAIRESPACTARFTLERRGTPMFDFTNNRAGFELEWENSRA